MALSITTLASEVVAEMNLAATYTNTPTDPRAYGQQILDNALNVDGAIVEAVCVNPDNGRRAAFITQATVAHAGLLPSRIGPIDAVTISSKGAIEWPLDEIENERTNRLSLTYDPHFAVVGNRLYHNQGATNATVDYCAYTRTSALQAPEEHAHVLLAGTLSMMFSVEGENTEVAAFYGSQYQAMLQAIRSNQSPPPFKSIRSLQAAA